MKKLIFGCTLILSGMIGSSAWIIAHAILVEPGAWSSITNIFGSIDGIVVILFLVIAILGAIIAMRAMKED